MQVEPPSTGSNCGAASCGTALIRHGAASSFLLPARCAELRLPCHATLRCSPHVQVVKLSRKMARRLRRLRGVKLHQDRYVVLDDSFDPTEPIKTDDDDGLAKNITLFGGVTPGSGSLLNQATVGGRGGRTVLPVQPSVGASGVLLRAKVDKEPVQQGCGIGRVLCSPCKAAHACAVCLTWLSCQLSRRGIFCTDKPV